MNISGIRPQEGFYSNITIKNADRAAPVSQEQETGPLPDFSTESREDSSNQQKPAQELTSYDYSKNYSPNVEYEMKGADSNLGDLDMERAISDMQKDHLLQQYQFFVGNSRQEAAVQSMNLRPMENFEV